MINQNFEFYNNMPPRAFLEQIIDGVTKIYLYLWDRKNEKNIVNVTWDDLSVYYHRNMFRSSLRKLCNSGLINYQELENGVHVEMTAWDDE